MVHCIYDICLYKQHLLHICPLGLGDISIICCHCDMILYIVLHFGYAKWQNGIRVVFSWFQRLNRSNVMPLSEPTRLLHLFLH